MGVSVGVTNWDGGVSRDGPLQYASFLVWCCGGGGGSSSSSAVCCLSLRLSLLTNELGSEEVSIERAIFGLNRLRIRDT